jgi:hypothetical protein
MSDPIKFDRTPYTITYKDSEGKMQKIRRVPPPKLHDALPTDVVELKRRRNEDFREGDILSVKHINPRHPNVLQVSNNEGLTTFVDAHDMELKEKNALRPGEDLLDRPQNNRYLRWP